MNANPFPMEPLGMQGSFPLDDTAIDEDAAGAQAAWGVQQRASLPVGAPRLRCVEAAAESSYTRFAFSYAASADDALAGECRNYEDFGLCGALDNPSRPVPNAAANRT
jgi:hypothetical protein